MSATHETLRLVQDHVRMTWLNLHAKEIAISSVKGGDISLACGKQSVVGHDLSDCVDKIMDKLEGRLPSRF